MQVARAIQESPWPLVLKSRLDLKIIELTASLQATEIKTIAANMEKVKEMAVFCHSSPKPITLASFHSIRRAVDTLEVFREALPREISGSTQEVSFSILHAP